ncbi:UPF0179 family protein [Halovivax gelatinilyticus]|uniref:UPF0179 family protein n=1 Tax=Halovivax gelatinilyticus TaxID=2961597 RepID=UPI0020CA6B86|nr:UPF0179 family protein [Halovivax gelatinilyticus]
MSTITLLGDRLAEPGTEFVYEGEAEACAGCPYRSQCLTLEVGRRYRVTDVRDNAQLLPCAVHDEGVRAVEVESTTVRANVPTDGTFAGATATLAGPCPYVECPSHSLCEPNGVEHGESARVVRIEGDPPHEICHLDRSLTTVELDPDG